MSPFFLSLFLFLLFPGCSSGPSEDKVTELPGINFQVRFEHYSGYLDAGYGNFFHYWFLESQSQPSKDPLLLFLNGGPGCSSMVALLTECGPFRIKEGGKKLVENPYAWTKLGNVVFVESPAGTGFSYSTNAWNLSDQQSLARHYDAILSFYAKFPEFKGRDLYLTGQSYAAIYMTTLAGRIVKNGNQFPGKLQGVAIGNGVLNLRQIVNGRFYYNYAHGLLGEPQWKRVVDECCRGQLEWRSCDLIKWYNDNSSSCYPLVKAALDVGSDGRDPYNVNFECYPESSEYPADEECGVPFGKITAHYLDREDVRNALHIPVDEFRGYSFEPCSDAVFGNYTKQFDDLTKPMSDLLKRGGVRILIYNGDFDSVCNFFGAQWFVDGLNRSKTGDRTPIYYTGITQHNVGYQQTYDGLDYLIIRGAGHYVPADRPRESLQILSNFITGQFNYSTPCTADTSPAPLLNGGGGNTLIPSESRSSAVGIHFDTARMMMLLLVAFIVP